MNSTELQQIVVLGNGVAAHQCALALSQSLPTTTAITLVRPSGECASDLMYGSLTSPQAYAFNLESGITEPNLILNSSTSFSFGTRYCEWGPAKREWMQCFHLPFHNESGVHFHHYMTRHKAQLTDYLISAQAALQGTFAHPPENNPRSALSRAEYGYHFDPTEWANLWLNELKQTSVKIVDTDIENIEIQNGQIGMLNLVSGEKLEADLFVDASGSESILMSKLSSDFDTQREVLVKASRTRVEQTGPAYRCIKAVENGWQSVTPLQSYNLNLEIKEKTTESNDLGNFKSHSLGRHSLAWFGNCVGIGHSAYMVEPLTPLPYMLLLKDISRLLELIPVNGEMVLESKEYNRRYADDLTHAELFTQALYIEHEKLSSSKNSLLERKLTQFEHRGIFANFDLEPFNNEDWAQLHAGMGRVPKYYDKTADLVDRDEMSNKLAMMKKGIAHLASQMPPHHIYINKLKQHLRENHG